MQDKVLALASLLKLGFRQNFRPFFVLLLFLVGLGLVMAVAAAYPILTPFIYSMF